jgi:Zn-dependent protease
MLSQLLHGRLTLQSAVAEILAVLVIIFLILPLHEWAHAQTAYFFGDKAIKKRGRLSLNPLSHVDPVGALFMLLVGFGWAKPVPVDPRNFKNPKVGMAITALMGPVSNLVAAFVGLLIYYTLWAATPGLFRSEFGGYVYTFLNFYIQVNINLAVFNLLPVPPLDGSKILFMFLPDKWVYTLYKYENFFFIIILALVWFNLLPLGPIEDALMNFVMWLTELPFVPFM